MTIEKLDPNPALIAVDLQAPMPTWWCATPGSCSPAATSPTPPTRSASQPTARYRRIAARTLDRGRPLLQTALHEFGRLSDVGPFAGPLVLTPVKPTAIYTDDSVGLLMGQPGPRAAHAAELNAAERPDAAETVLNQARRRATPTLIEVLHRYPPAQDGSNRTARLMKSLDSMLRELGTASR